MKLHTQPTHQYQTDTAYNDHRVEISAVHFDYCRLDVSESPPVEWPVAACRTYRIMIAEGRNVALALIIEPSAANA